VRGGDHGRRIERCHETPTPSAQTIAASVDGRARATEGRDGGDGRSAGVRVADEADSHDTLTADAGDHHR
jgi:hypothetical protein